MQYESRGFCALTGYGLLRVTGEDAVAFLQGQVTCDVAALPAGRSGLGALCNPKGRVIASFRLLRSDSGFEAGLKTCGMDIPEVPGAWIELPDRLILRLDDSSGRCLIAAETETAEGIWICLRERSGATPVSPALWRLKSIEAGLPEEAAEISEEFLPQMLNLDVLGGIGSQKGCYTGQEIIARTHYLGQIKRRLFRLRSLGEEEPRPGTLVYDAADAESRSVGRVIMATPESRGTFQVLAVIAVDHARNGDLRLFRPDGPTTELLPLPYSCEHPHLVP